MHYSRGPSMSVIIGRPDIISEDGTSNPVLLAAILTGLVLGTLLYLFLERKLVLWSATMDCGGKYSLQTLHILFAMKPETEEQQLSYGVGVVPSCRPYGEVKSIDRR